MPENTRAMCLVSVMFLAAFSVGIYKPAQFSEGNGVSDIDSSGIFPRQDRVPVPGKNQLPLGFASQITHYSLFVLVGCLQIFARVFFRGRGIFVVRMPIGWFQRAY